MPVAVTPENIEQEWRPLTASERNTISGRSAAAWTRIVALVPDVEESLRSGAVTEETVRSVMVSMIVRVLKNPDSVRTHQESIDDSSESWTLDHSVSTGELYLTEFEMSLLTATTRVPVNGMYIVGLGGP